MRGLVRAIREQDWPILAAPANAHKHGGCETALFKNVRENSGPLRHDAIDLDLGVVAVDVDPVHAGEVPDVLGVRVAAVLLRCVAPPAVARRPRTPRARVRVPRTSRRGSSARATPPREGEPVCSPSRFDPQN